MKKISMLVACATLAALSPAMADHIQSKDEAPLGDGGAINAKSFKTNAFIYKSIGGNVTVYGEEKKRSWKCLWLCKKRVKKNAEFIAINNVYYGKQAEIFIGTLERRKECRDASSCTQKEWAFGATPSQNFPSDGGDAKLVGVMTTHEVRVDGVTRWFTTMKGDHPDFGAAPIE